MNIVIGNDHAGTEYKQALVELIKQMGHSVQNYGTDDNASVDYPDYVHPVAKDVASGNANYGVLICGSGNGVCMTANKYQNVRAALCWSDEIAVLGRSHNDANIICIPARFVSLDEAKLMVTKFINEPFEGGRHQNRVNKIPCA
jgi:ribose 5-phosphate isomerase B